MDDTVNYSGSSHAALICLASEPEAVMHRRWRQNSENQFGEIGLGFCGFLSVLLVELLVLLVLLLTTTVTSSSSSSSSSSYYCYYYYY